MDFWDDLRMFIMVVMLAFLVPMAGVSGVITSQYLICNIAKSCEVVK